LIHLPIQTPTASQFGRRNILALLLRLLKIRPEAFPDLGAQSETRIGVVKDLELRSTLGKQTAID
jgi:hypothetical protein